MLGVLITDPKRCRLAAALLRGYLSNHTIWLGVEMVDVGAGDLAVGLMVTVFSYAATIFISRAIHKLITKGRGREYKTRWMAANGAGIAFVMAGLIWSPSISFKIAQVVTGNGSGAFEVLLFVFMMAFWAVIGGLIGFGIGKLRS